MSKKPTKSKSDESTTYSVNDIVLAKLRGFPAWPAQIVDSESVPERVKKERPQGKKTLFYVVRFFPAGDYSWHVAKDLSLLQKHEIEAYINEPHKKNADLLEGYKIALEPDKWHAEKEEEKKQAAQEEAEAEVDQLDEDGEPSEKKSKKRKRESEPKAKTKKANGTTGEKKKRVSKKGGKSAEGVESEDEAGSKPPTKKGKKEKANDKDLDNDPASRKVKDWRHALQRVFLGKAPPKADDMPQHDKLFTEVEQYDGLTIEHLTHSKIGKVMRHIAALDAAKIPREDEFNFRGRANTLVDKWHKIAGTADSQVNGDGEGDLTKMDVEPQDAPSANGVAAGDE